MRIDRNLLERLLAITVYTAYRQGATTDNVHTSWYEHWYRAQGTPFGIDNQTREAIATAARYAFDHGNGEDIRDTSMGAISREVAGLLNNKYDTSVEGDLVDSIVYIIKQAFPRNVLNASLLDRLKKAILTSEELVKVNKELKQREFSCYGCGAKLQNGQMTTYFGDNQGGVLYCAVCKPPQFTKCNHCERNVAVGMGLKRGISHATCDEHKGLPPSNKKPEKKEFDEYVGILDGARPAGRIRAPQPAAARNPAFIARTLNRNTLGANVIADQAAAVDTWPQFFTQDTIPPVQPAPAIPAGDRILTQLDDHVNNFVRVMARNPDPTEVAIMRREAERQITLQVQDEQQQAQANQGVAALIAVAEEE